MDPFLFMRQYEAIVSLNASEGPHSNVFEPKFTARLQIIQLKDTIINLYAADKSTNAMQQLARCLVFLGTNMSEVEEEKDGMVMLQKAHRVLWMRLREELPDDLLAVEPTPLEEILESTQHPLSRESNFNGCVEFMRVFSALGLMLSGQHVDHMSSAKRVLHTAEDAYKDWDAWFSEGADTCAITDLPYSDSGRLRVEDIPEAKKTLYLMRYEMTGGYISTIFYLAQVYASLRDVNLASQYCHSTMYYQLLCKREFVPKVWAADAIQLSGFYSNCFAYDKALHCLQAGQSIMPVEPSDESTTGLVAWGYARFYMHRLQHYGEVKENRVPRSGPSPDQFPYWVDFPIEGLAGAQPMPDIVSFDDARETFKEANKWLQAAIAFHPFDTSCTRHIELKQDMARLYGDLIVFETNRGRIVAMLQRRIDFLEGLPEQLSFNAYPIVIRQLLYDLGCLYEELIRVRQDQRRAPLPDEKPLKDKAFNTLVDKAVDHYTRFCESWRSPMTHELPDVLDEDSRVPFFRTLMRLAHLETTYASPTPKEEYDRLKSATKAFQRASEFAAKNPFTEDNASPSEPLTREVALADEMARLLQAKQSQVWATFQRGLK